MTALDSAAYRGRRILLPWVAYLAGLGQPWYVLQAYALVNVVSWMALAVLLLRWLPPGALRPAVAWATCMLGDGLMTSMRQSVPDGPSMLLLALGVAAVEQQRRGLAAGILGLAGLARETNLIGGLVLAPERVTARSGAALVLRGAGRRGTARPLGRIPVGTSGCPRLVLVSATLLRRLRGTPTSGPRLCARSTPEGWDSFARFSLLGLVALTTQFLVLLWQRDWRNPWWRMGAAYAGLMVVLGPAVWEGDPGAVTRVVVPMTIAFNVLLPKHRWFWPLWVLGNASVVHGFEVMRMPWLSGW